MSKRDYYEVLGVPRDADETAIKGAYRRLARQYHPDVNKAADAEERFKEINEAYEVLSDADRRAAYDRYGHAATQGVPWPGAGGFRRRRASRDLNDIFGEFFGGFGGTRGGAASAARARGADLRYDLEITFQEAVFGAEKEIEIAAAGSCARCCSGSRRRAGHQAHPLPAVQRQRARSGAAQQTILGQFVSVTTCPRCNGEREIVTSPVLELPGRRSGCG